MTTRLAALALVAALAACTACSGADSSAAPPTVVCGTTLSRSAAGPVLYDASSRPITITGISGDEDIYLKLAADCHTGVHFMIQPAAAAIAVEEARTSDGQTAAVVLRPVASRFNIQVERAGGARSVIKVSLTDPPTGTTHASS